MKALRTLFHVAAVAMCIACCVNAEAAGKKSKPKAKHVIFIGLDGMSAADFNAEEVPNIKSFMEEGCWTLKKRSVLPSSSAINWASMFMGVGTELHGYTTWGSKTPELESRVVNSHGIMPTMFSVIDEKHPEYELGCISNWETIKCLIDSVAVDYYQQINTLEELGEQAIRYITEKKPNLFAVCWDNPDHEGHTIGWGTEVYHEAVRKVDGYIGKIIQATKDAGIYDDCIFIVTADHGGIEKHHGGISLNEMETPFIICGKNIRNGGEITDSMMQFDVAATVTEVFGLERPQVWIGRPMNVFKK